MCWEWQKERLVLDRLKDRQKEIGKIAAANTTHTIGKKERERESIKNMLWKDTIVSIIYSMYTCKFIVSFFI